MAQQFKRLNDPEVRMLVSTAFTAGVFGSGMLYTVLRAGWGALLSARSLAPAFLLASVFLLLGVLTPRQDAKVRRTLALQGLTFFLAGLTFTLLPSGQSWVAGILLLAGITVIILGFTWHRRGMLSW